MKPSLLDHLICPNCQISLDLESLEKDEKEIKTGYLKCKNGCIYPITRYVPRFVDEDDYADSFSKQRLYVRRHFQYYVNDKSGDHLFLPTTGFSRESIAEGVSLEIGCGYGRFVDVVQRIGGKIIGIDLSTHSIDLAFDFIGSKENVFLVQCDLFNLPFRKDYFSHIYSIGVLHHTPDTKKAFKSLTPYLHSGGKISIWVYDPEKKRSANRWRTVATRLPHGLAYALCILNQILFSWIRALPGGWRFSYLIPGTSPKKGSHFWLRVMNDFDNLTPQYASAHSNEEVIAWFKETNLKNVKALTKRTSVIGIK